MKPRQPASTTPHARPQRFLTPKRADALRTWGGLFKAPDDVFRLGNAVAWMYAEDHPILEAPLLAAPRVLDANWWDVIRRARSMQSGGAFTPNEDYPGTRIAQVIFWALLDDAVARGVQCTTKLLFDLIPFDPTIPRLRNPSRPVPFKKSILARHPFSARCMGSLSGAERARRKRLVRRSGRGRGRQKGRPLLVSLFLVKDCFRLGRERHPRYSLAQACMKAARLIKQHPWPYSITLPLEVEGLFLFDQIRNLYSALQDSKKQPIPFEAFRKREGGWDASTVKRLYKTGVALIREARKRTTDPEALNTALYVVHRWVYTHYFVPINDSEE